MAQSIGIVSSELPQNLELYAKAAPNALVFWFNEIEAAYAFLLHSKLDQLIIDQKLANHIQDRTKKYQTLIEQMHPKALVSFSSLVPTHIQTKPWPQVIFYPSIETMFESGELKSVFQPIVRVNNNSQAKIIGFECLSRLYFNDCLYPPEILFHYAQEKLKLHEYDRICLRQNLLNAPKIEGLLVFINVRPQTLIKADFADWLKDLLRQTNHNAEQIVIELTEQQCIISEAELKDRCKSLQHQGFKLAVDDFGAGISNFSLLEIMQPEFLKVPGRFIKGVHQDKVKKIIAQTLINLASELNIVSIVENVESAADWLQVSSFGALFAQGFYFFKPMDKDELIAHLKK